MLHKTLFQMSKKKNKKVLLSPETCISKKIYYFLVFYYVCTEIHKHTSYSISHIPSVVTIKKVQPIIESSGRQFYFTARTRSQWYIDSQQAQAFEDDKSRRNEWSAAVVSVKEVEFLSKKWWGAQGFGLRKQQQRQRKPMHKLAIIFKVIIVN